MKTLSKILKNIICLIKIKTNSHIIVKNFFEGIVFSFNRPIQLFALLESYYLYCGNAPHLNIIYKATTNEYKIEYQKIADYFKNHNLTFILENKFREDLTSTIEHIESNYLFFLVDDNIFKSHFSFDDYLNLPNRDKYILSLRLGANLNHCYTLDKPQKLPKFSILNEFLSWEWKKEELDWNYIFSVDGTIYKTNEIREMSKLIPFKAPNSYEANMNIFRLILRRKKGLCYPNSIVLNLCLNRVQTEVDNSFGIFSTEKLLDIWNENKIINISHFHNVQNNSAHIEVEYLPLKERN